MISYGSVSRSTFPSVITAPTAELSVKAAMGDFRPAPVVLDGTLRSGLTIAAHNEARLEGWARAEEKRAEAEAKALAEAEAELAEFNAMSALLLAEEDARVAWDDIEPGEVRVITGPESGVEIVEYTDGDAAPVLAEVMGFIDDAEGETWARLRTENGELVDVAEGAWAETTGSYDTLMAAYDRMFVHNVRADAGLVFSAV